MDRRRFGAMAVGAVFCAGEAEAAEPEVLRLKPNGWVPNNLVLPVLLYRAAFLANTKDLVGTMEAAFGRNGWPAQWRNGVYDFHHYHSTTHEVLGFAGGEAEIMLGGEGSRVVTVRAGDVALLPVGTGHCRVRASADLLVIGAYPAGEHFDICRRAPDAAATGRMAKVTFPPSDPVHGGAGPMVRLWKA